MLHYVVFSEGPRGGAPWCERFSLDLCWDWTCATSALWLTPACWLTPGAQDSRQLCHSCSVFYNRIVQVFLSCLYFPPFNYFDVVWKKKQVSLLFSCLLSGFQISFYQAIHTNITKYVSDKWFWSVKKSLGLLLKLKGFAYVVWASALGSKGSRFMSAQRPIHFPTSSTPRKGLHS